MEFNDYSCDFRPAAQTIAAKTPKHFAPKLRNQWEKLSKRHLCSIGNEQKKNVDDCSWVIESRRAHASRNAPKPRPEAETAREASCTRIASLGPVHWSEMSL
jgi:hypothetical protein